MAWLYDNGQKNYCRPLKFAEYTLWTSFCRRVSCFLILNTVLTNASRNLRREGWENE